MKTANELRDYCEACGYTESHDPNCPRPRSDTPRTDEAELSLLDIQNGHGPSPYVPAELACQLERELNAALICAGVASKERGEWAIERESLLENAALECDREADRQSAYANEAASPGLKMIHGTTAHTLMAVACRIRGLTHTLQAADARQIAREALAAGSTLRDAVTVVAPSKTPPGPPNKPMDFRSYEKARRQAQDSGDGSYPDAEEP